MEKKSVEIPGINKSEHLAVCKDMLIIGSAHYNHQTFTNHTPPHHISLYAIDLIVKYSQHNHRGHWEPG